MYTCQFAHGIENVFTYTYMYFQGGVVLNYNDMIYLALFAVLVTSSLHLCCIFEACCSPCTFPFDLIDKSEKKLETIDPYQILNAYIDFFDNYYKFPLSIYHVYKTNTA